MMLKDNLAHINVGQNPYEMGRQAILTLYKIVTKQKYQEIIYTPVTFCSPQNFNTCEKRTGM
jgi:ribose transport system substrate-binding protein